MNNGNENSELLKDHPVDYNDIKIGDMDSLTGQPIIYINFSSSDFIVDIDEKLSLNWQTSATYNNYATDFGEVVGSCDLSGALVDRIFGDKVNNLAYKKMIGSVIVRILDDRNSDSARKLLTIVDERINEHGRERVRMVYIITALITVLFVGILLIAILVLKFTLQDYGMDEVKRMLVLCSLLGGIGAFITTFGRFNNYKGSLVAGVAIHKLDGFLRIFYGLIAGLFIILAIRSNVLIGFANDSKSSIPWLYYFLAMIAGASEILIPNLVKQTEGELGIKKLEKKELEEEIVKENKELKENINVDKENEEKENELENEAFIT